MLFLNCGAYLDLTQQWFYKKEFRVNAYLIDSHRPFRHMNINDPENKIFIIDDGCKSLTECPTYEDYQVYQQLCASMLEDDEDEDSYDSEDEGDQGNVNKLVEKTGMIDEEEEAELVK